MTSDTLVGLQGGIGGLIAGVTAFLLVRYFHRKAWGILVTHYPAKGSPKETQFRFQSGNKNFFSWRSCLAVSCEPEGLFVRVMWPWPSLFGAPPLLIPWNDLQIEDHGFPLRWISVQVKKGDDVTFFIWGGARKAILAKVTSKPIAL